MRPAKAVDWHVAASSVRGCFSSENSDVRDQMGGLAEGGRLGVAGKRKLGQAQWKSPGKIPQVRDGQSV